MAASVSGSHELRVAQEGPEFALRLKDRQEGVYSGAGAGARGPSGSPSLYLTVPVAALADFSVSLALV